MSKSGKTVRKVRDVASIFRKPNSRIASAFVHEMHDCGLVGKRGNPNAEEVCRGLLAPNTTAEERMFLESRVIKFANCVSGCGTRLHIGGGCSHHANYTNLHGGSFESQVPLAIRKMKRFAFVGLTDRWSESMCLFAEKFPRRSGKPYPSETINTNVRPTLSKSCEQEVEDILVKADWHDVLDEAMYEAYKERFESELEMFPQCKSKGSP